MTSARTCTFVHQVLFSKNTALSRYGAYQKVQNQIWQDECDPSSHTPRGEKSQTTRTLDSWKHLAWAQDLSGFLQGHNIEHPDRWHLCMVRALCCQPPQSTPDSSAQDSPGHHGCKIPSIQGLCNRVCINKTRIIINDPSDPIATECFCLLESR